MTVDARFQRRQGTRDRMLSDTIDDSDIVSGHDDEFRGKLGQEDNYKAEIVRQLIENFDLERTLDRYRNIESKSFEWKLNDFSLDGQTHARRLRKRLSDLMGTDVVQINNREYNAKLSEKIQQRRQASEVIHEAERAELERTRLRRLLSEGIITSQDFHEALKQPETRRKQSPESSVRFAPGSFPHASKCKSAVQGRAKLSRNSSYRRSKSAPPNLHKSTRSKSKNYNYQDKSRPSTQARNRDIQQSPASRGKYSTTPRSQLEMLDDSKDFIICGNHYNSKERPTTQPIASARHSSSTKDDYKVTRPKYRDPVVEELWREETLEGMYKIAEEILPLDRPKLPQLTRVKKELPKEKPKKVQLRY